MRQSTLPGTDIAAPNVVLGLMRIDQKSDEEIRELVAMAERHGLELVGELDDAALAHPERPVHWTRVDLDYTFILLTFRRR